MKRINNRILKKLFLVVITFLLLIFTSCDIGSIINDEPKEISTTYTIYTINDFHGCIFENGSQAGISKIGGFLKEKKDENPDTTLIISAGDMFQGTAVSSMTRGKSVLEVMNYIGFDAMTIGNHEFDWGIEEVLKYQDGDSTNGEADFPFLACNIRDKKTGKLADWATPYTIVEKNGIKFGIIGVIGVGEESDILTSYVEKYEFTNELNAIKKYTKILRSEEGADIVIVSTHSDTEAINVTLSSLTGDFKVDAIINGHTHSPYYGSLEYGDRTAGLPYVQSGCYGQYVGKITLTVFNKTKEVVSSDVTNLKATSYCYTPDENIDNIINKYQDEISKANEELGYSATFVTKDLGGAWCSNVIRDAGEAEVGIVNTGGIRANAFPINIGDLITYGDIFEMMPFENKIVSVSIKGSELINLIDYSGLFVSTNVDRENKLLDGKKIENNEYYRVATIDFLFEKNNYPFKRGINVTKYDVLFRDAIAEATKANIMVNGKFRFSK